MGQAMTQYKRLAMTSQHRYPSNAIAVTRRRRQKNINAEEDLKREFRGDKVS